jgi:hypothetical protein
MGGGFGCFIRHLRDFILLLFLDISSKTLPFISNKEMVSIKIMNGFEEEIKREKSQF